MPSQLSDTLLASHEQCLFTVKSAAQFAKMLKQCHECYCFVLYVTHLAAYIGNKSTQVNLHSEQMVDKLEKQYPDLFYEPVYPIWEHRQPF